MKNSTGHEVAGRVGPRRNVQRLSRSKSNPRSSGTATLHIDRILVPLDFSEAANTALAYAVALATDMRAKIILMHVIEPVYVSADPGLTCMPLQTQVERKAGIRRLRELAFKFIPRSVFDKIVVAVGAPYNEIATAAKRLKAGLIVITTHGRTGLSHALLGSTAERVVRHAPCPVLTLRRTE
jgi:nucleotide-binding universal stress UspA family protein